MSEKISITMLQKIKEFLVGKKDKDISPAEANKIQSTAYMLSHTEVKKKYTPTYETIALELESEDRQVFEAAASYLKEIAVKKTKYQPEIVAILNKKMNSKQIKIEFKEILKNKLREISGKNK